MTVVIPESVFTKYFSVIDSTFDIFGVDCQLVYVDKVEEISNTYNNVPVMNSISSRRRRLPQQKTQNTVIREVEKLEDIRIKVYWEPNEVKKMTGGNVTLPEGAIMIICYGTDVPRIKRAKEIIVHKNIKDLQEMRYKLYGEPIPMGLRKTRYFMAFLERSR